MLSIKEKQVILEALFTIAIDMDENDNEYMQGVYNGAKQVFINLFKFSPDLMVNDVVNDWKQPCCKAKHNHVANLYIKDVSLIIAKRLKSKV